MSKYNIIEKTALEMAAVIYETGRSQGMTSKYKNARAYAAAKFEYYIPKAVDILLSMMNRTDISDHIKDEIYNAIMERSNDPKMSPLNGSIPEFKEDLIFKSKFEEAFQKAMKGYSNGKEIIQ